MMFVSPESLPATGCPAVRPHVTMQGVSKDFAGVVAVDDISLSIAKGEFFALLGPSGCGKTTTLRMLAGLETPTAGVITIDGRPMFDADNNVPPEARGVGIVFQDYALFPHMTIFENVAFGLHRQGKAVIAARVGELLELVGLADAAKRYPHELSGGQRQRVALARSLAPAPAVILLDEPFSNLDAELRVGLRNETKDILKAAGATVVLVTHDQEEAFSLSDRVGVMDKGRLVQVDIPYTIYHDPADRFVAEFTGVVDFVPATVRGCDLVSALGIFPHEGPKCPEATTGHLVVRPDDVRIEPSPQGEAIVTAARFLGADALYTLALPGGLGLHSLMSSTRLIAEGARVEIVFDPAHTVFFPE